MNINDVTFVGYLAQDVKYSPGKDGKSSRATGRIAVNRMTPGEVDYFNFVVFGKKADALAKYGHKGKEMGLVGEMRMSTYKDSTGKPIERCELYVFKTHYGHDSENHKMMKAIRSGQLPPPLEPEAAPQTEQPQYNQQKLAQTIQSIIAADPSIQKALSKNHERAQKRQAQKQAPAAGARPKSQPDNPFSK